MRFDGNITCFGLPLVRFTTEERLDEIIRLHEDNGCPIFNPHRYTLEEGGMKQTDEVQLAFKREADPQGLLNPGKMIAWENPDYDYRSGKTFLFEGLQQGVVMASGMNILVLHAHPVETSFNAALHRLIVERLTAARPRGRRLRSLCRGFRSAADPRRAARLSRSARPTRPRSSPMSSGCSPPRRWCFPSRSGTTAFRRSSKATSTASSCPACRSGWSTARRSPTLHNIRKVAAVTTYGGSRFRAMLMGDPPRKLVNAHAARDREARRAGVLPGALFDEPVDRRSRASLHGEGRGEDGRVLMRGASSSTAIPCRKVSARRCATRPSRRFPSSGCEVRLVDLYAESSIRSWAPTSAALQSTARRPIRRSRRISTTCKWAEAILFVYPTWWYGLPAMLKGWLDRVWATDVAFKLPAGSGRIVSLMTHIRRVGVVTTCGAPWWLSVADRPAGAKDDPARHARALRAALPDVLSWRITMDASTPESRAAFLAKVG